MLLKKINLSGFKSFADKITINFDRGITGIVGPNGSGKSNVIDAVRWVMGEQNAKNLRGQQATDIIFAGSAKRKALAMAEVTLVFDNSMSSSFCPPEFRHEPEISLTRRLYTDGTREYLINKKPCRLKDIVSFFATTGLGGRSYSMIQQGQVERILNAKPEQIREILEEAAGTLAFKMRRNEAQKKLETTKENLSRLEDIIAELERQRVALEGQVEKAKKWRDLSTDLRNQELELLAHNYQFFRGHMDELERQYNEAQSACEACQNELTALEVEHKTLQDQMDRADPDLDGLHELVTIIREDIARAESTLLNARSLLETGDEDIAARKNEIEADRENLQKVENQFARINDDWQEARQKAEALREQIENFQAEVDTVDESSRVFENKIEDSEDQLRNIERLLDSNTVRCESIAREQQKLAGERDQVVERKELLQRELGSVGAELEVARKRVSEKEEGLGGDFDRRSFLEQSTRSRQGSSRQLQEERDRLKEIYIDCRSRKKSLEEFIASASDVSSAIIKLGELDRNSEDLHYGLLTQYLSFREDIDALPQKTIHAFERWAERIVVRDIEDFNQMARLAQQTDIGAVPVTVIEGSELGFDETKAQSWANAVDAEPLQSFLNVSEDGPSLNSVLKRLYYLPSLQLSPRDLNTMPPGVIVFTAQGVTTNSPTDLEIGSQKGAGLLSRKAELEQLDLSLEQHQSALARVQGELDKAEMLQKTELQELQELEEKLRNQNQEVLQLMSALQALEQQHKLKLELVEAADRQLNAIHQSESAALKELEELGENRISLGQERESIQQELEQIRFEAGSIEEQREEVFRLHQSRKVDLATSEVKAQTLEVSFNQNKEQMERLQTALNRRYHELARLEEEIEEARQSSTKATEEMGDLIARREQLEEELSAKREENAGILEQLRAVDAKLKTVREHHHSFDKKMNSVSIELERARIGVSSAVQQSAEKYHEDISQFKIEIDPDFNIDKASRAVSRLRNQIENLGGINMMAIEEYDQLRERSDFILAQREEVLSSIDLLQEAIEEMDESSKNRFLDAFTAINHEFGLLFPILFPGGDAKLEMTNPEDPLNAGVDIMVRLPGKKQQSLNLFSGGEKALTAISLIFALLKSKPTPFCFLDEVDAPLDEANVGRYNRVLEALSDRFQFIVITHNRRTMEVLDTLYGVTMQEPGVSKVVGVDLSKDLPDHLRKAFKENKAGGNKAEGAPQATLPSPDGRSIAGATAGS
jgi:chromosome segregation protein